MLLAFLGGVLAGELLQLGTWKTGHPGQPWKGYFDVGLPHLLINGSVVAAVGVSWQCGLLTKILDLTGATPIAQLLEVSPPFGFLLATAADVYGDRIAFAFRDKVSRFLPFEKKDGEGK
jgi:hypothetical protein